MNSIEECSTTHKGDLLHYLTGKFSPLKDGKYRFYLHDNATKKHFFYDADDYVEIFDPAFDSSFKSLFVNKEKRLMDILNNLHFIPNGKKLVSIEFIVGEHYDIGKKYNLNSPKPDIACLGKIENGDNILIDVEIQIRCNKDLDDRFFEYGSLLRIDNTNMEMEKEKNSIYKEAKEKNLSKKTLQKNLKNIKRKYNDVIVFAIILDNKEDNNNICLYKKTEKSNESTEVPTIKIFEYNVPKILKSLNESKNVSLFDKPLNKNGADWLKLLGIMLWAYKKEGNYSIKYYFPKLKGESERYSDNIYIEETIRDLIAGGETANLINQIQEEIMEEFEKREEEILMEANKKSQLITLYNLLINGQNKAMDFIPLNFKYTEREIYSILQTTGVLRLGIISILINYLKQRSALISN